MKPLNLRANGGKHRKLLLGNNATRKCLPAHMQHFFSTSPAMEKEFAESAFFHTKIKSCHETVEFTSYWWENIKNYSGATQPHASVFTPTCNTSSARGALSRKNSLSRHFFIQKPNTCHETVEFTSQSRQNTKNNSWATMPLASAFRPTCNLSSALAPLGRKNSLSQHFFIQKSKTCQETVEFTSQWGQNIKSYSWETMPHASAFTPTCNIPRALAALSRKNSLNQHFFIQKSKTCHETIEFTSHWGKTPKTTPGQQCHTQVPSRPHARFLQP